MTSGRLTTGGNMSNTLNFELYYEDYNATTKKKYKRQLEIALINQK